MPPLQAPFGKHAPMQQTPPTNGEAPRVMVWVPELHQWLPAPGSALQWFAEGLARAEYMLTYGYDMDGGTGAFEGAPCLLRGPAISAANLCAALANARRELAVDMEGKRDA